jgi:hypothetical protein
MLLNWKILVFYKCLYHDQTEVVGNSLLHFEPTALETVIEY